MTTRRRAVWVFLAAIFTFTAAIPGALAQNFSLDARRIGMGGAGDAQTIASRLVEEQQPYRSIGLPFGLIQVWNRRDIFNPDHNDFDPVRAAEYGGNPLHLTLRRDSVGAGNRLVKDLVDADVNRDLNAYRIFTPSSEIDAAGLASPNWGKTLRFARDPVDGSFHGIYIGAGPYISIDTHLDFDDRLLEVLGSPTPVYRPNMQFQITDDSGAQGALAVTGGYRGRFPLPALFSGLATGSRNEGLYFASDFHYLHGFRYEAADLLLQFETDGQGLITLNPSTTPVVVNRATSETGRGFALDAAMALVTEEWDLTFGVDGIANRINWEEFTGERYTLQSLFSGGDFVTQGVQPPFSSQRVTLPVRYSGSGTYRQERWSASAEAAKTLQGGSFSAGGEYLWKRLSFRGGGRYVRDLWHGSAGIGFNISEGFGVDAAAFQTTTNLEEEHRISFAFSLRFNRRVE
jgi:hypothetical protein